MLLTVGSTSDVKIAAVKELALHYRSLRRSTVVGVQVDSDIPKQPMSFEETMLGATSRAKNAYEKCAGAERHRLGFGIESGLIKMPMHTNKMFNVCVCAIYTGDTFCIGMSSGFEVPTAVLELILNGNYELRDAFIEAQVAKNKSAPVTTGVIEFLTNGMVNRVVFTKQAVMMALIKLEHPTWYGDTHE